MNPTVKTQEQEFAEEILRDEALEDVLYDEALEEMNNQMEADLHPPSEEVGGEW